MLEQLHKEFPEKVRIVFRHFPLPGHPNSMITAQAAEAAGLQGKFWEMHDAIFARQAEWSQLAAPEAQTWLISLASYLKLDVAKFTTDLTSDAMVTKAKEAQTSARTIGVPHTPYLLLNGSPYDGQRDLETLRKIIQVSDLIPRQFAACPEMTVDKNKTYVATLTTSKGDIVIEMYPKIAPMTVNSFVFLARKGWFDNVSFHWVTRGFAAQSGDPTGTGFGSPGYYFDNEISPNLTFNEAGMVGMANSGAGMNGSQFFITYAPLPKLNGKYTVFGKVISGMDVAQKLTPRDASAGGVIPEGDKILKVTIQEK